MSFGFKPEIHNKYSTYSDYIIQTPGDTRYVLELRVVLARSDFYC